MAPKVQLYPDIIASVCARRWHCWLSVHWRPHGKVVLDLPAAICSALLAGLGLPYLPWGGGILIVFYAKRGEEASGINCLINLLDIYYHRWKRTSSGSKCMRCTAAYLEQPSKPRLFQAAAAPEISWSPQHTPDVDPAEASP